MLRSVHFKIMHCLIMHTQVDVGSRVVRREAAEEWCARNGRMPYYETSAKDNINVEKVLMLF